MKALKKYLFEYRFRFSRFQFNLAALFFLSAGFVFGVYFTISEIILPRVFALSDTLKTWNFTTATAGDYTYDSDLVTVDDNGAHPVSGVNKLTNPSFTSGNSSWNVAANPPSGWVEVPGSATYSTSNFLVMKYEAKCAATSDPTTGLTSPDTGYNTYDDSTTPCTSANNRQVVSVASGYPIAKVTHPTAVARCESITLGSTTAHLITNDEWMTIARNAEAQADNWTLGSVGSGYLFAGHNDNSPSKPRIASTTDTGNYRCAYTDGDPGTEAPSSCPTNTANGQSGTTGSQVRTLTLSNGSVIWDLAGNVWEHIKRNAADDTITDADQPDANGGGGFEWNEFTALTDYGTLSYDFIRPANSSYDATEGVGRIHHCDGCSGTTQRVFLRGGKWNDATYTGAFTLRLYSTTANSYYYVGFRCASDPVAISQSWSSSSGRSGGGNTITIGSVTDGKIYQLVNVGDASSYNFSVYVYNNTSGSEGETIDENVAQLYYNGSVISTTYTNTGSGWWKLSGTLTGANEEREYGLLIKAGKAVIVDDFTLSKQGEYSVYTTSAYTNSEISSWDSFSASVTASGNAMVYYQICLDDGSSCSYTTGSRWQYYTAGTWTNATDASTIYANTAGELTQTAMQALSVASQKISVKAIMVFGGEDTPSITSITIGLTTDTIPPTTNASSLAMKKQAGGDDVSENGWTNNSAPYFSWTAGADNDGGVGLKGYCLYLGSDAEADPATSKGLLGTSPVSTSGSTCQFIINATSIDFATASYRGATWLSSSSDPYYLKIKAIDKAENVYTGDAASFAFYFDNTPPSNPSGLSPPQEYQGSISSFTIFWPTSGDLSASDSHSGLKGYQYKIGSSGTWYGSSHTGGEDCDDVITTGSYTLNKTYDSLSEGENTFYLRTWDNACNVASTSITAILKYSGTAPTAPQNLTATPSTNTSNSFAFSWEAPETYSGQESGLSYCYTINTVPSAATCTWTSNTSLSADAYATQPSTNTFYVVAKDEAGNVNYDVYSSINFTCNTSAPGVPRNVDVADISIKATSNWKLAISWDEPSDIGAGVSTYKIYRSTTATSCSSSFSSFSLVGSTAGTSYSDTGLSQQTYYYCVKACDSANNCSAVSSTVSGYPDGKYTEPATLTSGPTVSSITTKKATITWSTNRNSDSKVQYGTSSGSYFTEEIYSSTQTTSHSITLSNLKAGTTYYYKAKWTDEDGNTGTSDEKSFTTDPPPSVKEVSAKNITLSSAIVQFTSKDATKAKIYYGKTTAFGGAKEISVATTETIYTIELTELDDGTKYYYKVNLFDSENEEYEGDIYSFETLPRPRISRVRLQQVKGTAQPTILVTWKSNTEISSIVTYYPAGRPEEARDEISIKLVKGEHKMLIRGLMPETPYILIVKGRDKIGNEARSDSQKFTTASDTRPPIISNLTVEGVIQGVGSEATAQLLVSWNTDEPATSQVEFGEGTGTVYSQRTQEDGKLTLNHLVIISNLTPSKVYHLRAISKDKAGNIGRSVDMVSITPKATESALELVIQNLGKVFGY